MCVYPPPGCANSASRDMNPATPTDTARRARPHLRLLNDERPASPASRHPHLNAVPGPCDTTAAASSSDADLRASGPASVLVAGADSIARARMLIQLRRLLPADTPFVEVSETWEVVARAPQSRMVVLTGDLRDLSTRGLMRVLSRRHPMLAVIVLESRLGDAEPPQLDAASL